MNTTATTTTTTTSTTAHILVIPYPAQGHLIPLLDLTHRLAATTNLTITILTTPKNHHLLSSFPANVTPLILPFPLTPGIPDGTENTKFLPPTTFQQLIAKLSLLEEPLLQWFESHPSPPKAIISDLFVGWTQRFARKMGIKRLVFSASGGLALSVIYSLWRDMPKAGDEDDVVLFRDVPNRVHYPWWQLSPIYRSYQEGDVDSQLIKEGFIDDMDSFGLVINSFDELERVYLTHLMSVMGQDRVWAVGPLFPPHGLKDRGGSSTVEYDLISSWLDTCRENEVIYVSFGTQDWITTQQIAAVVEALEKSRVRFIWSVSDLVVTRDTILRGFEKRVANRGMIVKGWAPQVSILRHKAVGTFLTHCGWNSVLEALMEGVGMLAWPLGADHFSNATLIVDQLKVAVRVCEGTRKVPDPNVLAQMLDRTVDGNVLDRQKIAKLHSSCIDAVKEGGSSYMELVRLVDELTK